MQIVCITARVLTAPPPLMRTLHRSICSTWQYNESEAYDAALLALQLGYTHIDCALGYDNQVKMHVRCYERTRTLAVHAAASMPKGLHNLLARLLGLCMLGARISFIVCS
jgi:hypothetical protein